MKSLKEIDLVNTIFYINLRVSCLKYKKQQIKIQPKIHFLLKMKKNLLKN